MTNSDCSNDKTIKILMIKTLSTTIILIMIIIMMMRIITLTIKIAALCSLNKLTQQ